jgi:alkylated DNA repair dioxygenase AlkB
VVEAVEFLTGYDSKDYLCEAGIINFYQAGDSLTAHQDRSEANSTAPLVSFRLDLLPNYPVYQNLILSY